jgi:hypothetical protein
MSNRTQRHRPEPEVRQEPIQVMLIAESEPRGPGVLRTLVNKLRGV